MSRLTIIGVTALIILLVGASAVLAQGNTPFGGGMMGGTGGTNGGGMMGGGNGSGMMGGTNGGTHGPGMMGGTDGNGMMGNGTHMTTENRDRMRDAMNTGNWDEMANICRDTATTATR